MRTAMGYPRVFVRIFNRGQVITGRSAEGVLQQARALQGDYMDLNLAASQGLQSWWTAVLDTGAASHAVNQDTAERFGLRHAGDLLSRVNGVDGEEIKGNSYIFGLSLAGSDGGLYEQPAAAFLPVEPSARFNLELSPYQPRRRVSPEGANLIGMSAARQLVIEMDTGNATTAMLREPLDLSTSRAFEESLRGVVAGPRVRLLPPSFRPSNEVVRLPLRYVDSARLRGGVVPASPQVIPAPLVMGVRGGHQGRQSLGNFLLDTGSPVTLISRRMAFQLGLTGDAGPAYDSPDFRGRLVGVTDRPRDADGFVIDSLELLALDGRIVQWRKVPVYVYDVVIRQVDGGWAVHDGILGNNLFLPSTNGEMTEKGLRVRSAAFEKLWFNGPLAELWLQVPQTVETR